MVTDSVTSNPIVGARVNAMGGHHQRGGYAITNENGEYLIENLQPGSYQVSAMAHGYLAKHYPEPVAVVAGQTTPDINFALAPLPPPPLPGGISGVVTDSATGNPIVGARVNAMGGHHQRGGYAITNQNGEYTIANLRPGSYTVKASAAGYTPKVYPEPVVVLEGQITPNINFALALFVPPQPGSISGIVTDSTTGNPIAGATVMAMQTGRHHSHGGHAVTGPDGTYTIENLMPGEYRVMAYAQGFAHKAYPDSVVVQEGQNTSNINFVLAPRSQNLQVNPQIRLNPTNTRPSRAGR